MFFNDKKRVSSIILSKTRGNGEEIKADVASESDMHNEYTSLAEELLSAIQSGSVQHLAALLRQFHELIEELDAFQDERQ